MKAVVYRGFRDWAIEGKPEPKIERPTDTIAEITSMKIGGSDSHMYKGGILGHENLGVVLEVGPAVERIKPGKRVCREFKVIFGHCENCERRRNAYGRDAIQPGHCEPYINHGKQTAKQNQMR